MPAKKYSVELSDTERAELESFLSSGESVRATMRARILLKADDGAVDREIVEALGCGSSTYDPDRPLVCFDEHPTELTAEVCDPEPATPGSPAKQDYQYERQDMGIDFCRASGELVGD